MHSKKLCYPDTHVLIFLPSRIPRTRVGFRHPYRIPSVICRVPKNSNESDTRTRVHVTLAKSMYLGKPKQPITWDGGSKPRQIFNHVLIGALPCKLVLLENHQLPINPHSQQVCWLEPQRTLLVNCQDASGEKTEDQTCISNGNCFILETKTLKK